MPLLQFSIFLLFESLLLCATSCRGLPERLLLHRCFFGTTKYKAHCLHPAVESSLLYSVDWRNVVNCCLRSRKNTRSGSHSGCLKLLTTYNTNSDNKNRREPNIIQELLSVTEDFTVRRAEILHAIPREDCRYLERNSTCGDCLTHGWVCYELLILVPYFFVAMGKIIRIYWDTLRVLFFFWFHAWLSWTHTPIHTLALRLPRCVARLGICCTPSERKLLLQNWTKAFHNLIPNGEEQTFVDRSSCLNSCVTENSDTALEVSMLISKA